MLYRWLSLNIKVVIKQGRLSYYGEPSLFVAYKPLYGKQKQLKIYIYAQMVAQLAKAQLGKRVFREKVFQGRRCCKMKQVTAHYTSRILLIALKSGI